MSQLMGIISTYNFHYINIYQNYCIKSFYLPILAHLLLEESGIKRCFFQFRLYSIAERLVVVRPAFFCGF